MSSLSPCGPLKPPHRFAETCVYGECKNAPPGYDETRETWSEYEQRIRYQVLLNRYLAVQKNFTETVYKHVAVC